VFTGVAAFVANELSRSSLFVALATVGGLVLSSVVTWLGPLVRAMRKPRRIDHWRSQVCQLTADSVEFDLYSACDHEVAAIRAEVVEPDGTIAHSRTIPTPQDRVFTGGYRGVGNYPQHFDGSAPLIDGAHYVVVWLAKRQADSAWYEIGRQSFVTPVPDGRLLQGPGLGD
jgi:hypothetical protein